MALFCYKLAHCEYTHVYLCTIYSPVQILNIYKAGIYTSIYVIPNYKNSPPEIKKKSGSKNEFYVNLI